MNYNKILKFYINSLTLLEYKKNYNYKIGRCLKLWQKNLFL